MTIRRSILTTATCAAFVVMSSVATAGAASHHSRDRDRDALPDKWEKAHHLSTRSVSTFKDPDHDGLSNRAEFLDGTNPRKADSDHDGVKDGREHNLASTDDPRATAVVVSLTNDVLTLRLADNSTTVVGNVTAKTKIECETVETTTTPTDPTTAARRSHGSDDSSDDSSDDQGEDTSGSDDNGSDDNGSDDQGEDSGDHNGGTPCDTTMVTVGAQVIDANIGFSATGLVFRELTIVA